MKQTTTTLRYEKLLRERLDLGRRYVDTLSHGSPFDDAHRLFQSLDRLDRELRRFRRYRLDEYCVVMAAEDERWHVPGEPPISVPACALCLRDQLVLPRDLVLPTNLRSDATLGGAA